MEVHLFSYFRHALYFVGPNQSCVNLAFLFSLTDLNKDNIKSIKILTKCNILITEDRQDHSSFISYLIYQEISGGSSGGSNEPPLEPKLFHFHGEFQEKLVKSHKSNPPQLI